jgi:hypothetical protein
MEPATKKRLCVGGIKLPIRLSLSVWGRRANLAMRVRVLQACYKQRRSDDAEGLLKKARQQALDGLEDPRDALALHTYARALFSFRKMVELPHCIDLAKHDLDVEEDLWEERLVVTPIRNPLHLVALRLEGILPRHPWARFLEWYLLRYPSLTAQKSVFGPQQYLQTERVHARLLRGAAQADDEPTVLLWRPEGAEPEEFYLYCHRRMESELVRLQSRVQALHEII